MEITFNESVEDFELTFNFGKVIIPIRKIKLFLDKISEDEITIYLTNIKANNGREAIFR